MSVKTGDLIQLYSATLEELRHHERTYVQAFIGMAILIPVFLAAIGLLFGPDTPLLDEYIVSVKVVVFIALVLLIAFFWTVIHRLNRRFTVCRDTLKAIETKLREIKNADKDSTLKGLLIAEQLAEKSFDTWFIKPRFYIYVPLTILALIIVGIFLFKFIG